MSTPGDPVVWVLVHDLERAGVPIVLERMVRALDRPDAFHVVAIRGGPVRERLGPWVRTCTVLEPDGRRSVPDALSVGARQLRAPGLGRRIQRDAWSFRLRDLPDPDVVVVHGAGAWPLVIAVRNDAPIVLHFHELDLGLDRSIDRPEQVDALARASTVLAVSRPVADLAVRRGADPAHVELLPGVVDVRSAGPPGAGTALPGRGRDDARAVMGAGTPGWRKATDRVAAVAHELSRRGRPGAVGWVGGRPSGPDTRWVSGLDPVWWFDEMDDPWDVMDGADVILVPSREDPLPLVALEAGLRSKAVVATPTGGLVDLLGGGRGAVAPGHDVGWLAGTTASLLDHGEERAQLGAALHDEVLANHDAAVVARMWWAVLRAAAR